MSRLTALIHQRGRELKKEVDKTTKRFEDSLGVLSPCAFATLQFFPSEFSFDLPQFGQLSHQTEESSSSSSSTSTAVIRDQGGVTVTTTDGEVILSLFGFRITCKCF